MKKYFFTAVTLMSLPFIALAQGDIRTCPPQKYLMNGFDMGQYQACEAVLQQCPKNGPYLDVSCIKATAARSECTQLAAIAAATNSDISQLSAQSVGTNLTTIGVSFPADGKTQYYIASRNGCLINTVVDPRKLNSLITQPYQGMSLLITNAEPLKYMQEADGTQSLESHLQLTKDCAACAVIGNAEVKFNFTPTGEFKAIHLHAFDAMTKP